MTSKAQKKRERWAQSLERIFGTNESSIRLREQNRRVDKRKRDQRRNALLPKEGK